MNGKALICGVAGQDGAHLAQSLLGQSCGVYGTPRDAEDPCFRNLRRFWILNQAILESMTRGARLGKSLGEQLGYFPADRYRCVASKPMQSEKDLVWEAQFSMPDVVHMMSCEQSAKSF